MSFRERTSLAPLRETLRQCLAGAALALALPVLTGTAALGLHESPAAHLPEQGIIPEQSIVRIQLKRVSEGILIRDQYIPQPTIYEASEFQGIVFDSSGHVVSYVGDSWPAFDAPETSQAVVRTLGGQEYPARIVGVDRRLSLLLLASDLPGDRAIAMSTGGEPNHFNVLTAAAEQVHVGASCVRSRLKLDGIPLVELKVSSLDVGQWRWAGGVAFDLDGKFAGFIIRAEAHPFSKKLSEVHFLPGNLVQSSVERVLREGRSIPAGWLGVSLTQEGTNIRVTQVVAGSPAAEAGLKPADTIVQLDGRNITFSDLLTAIRWKGPGERATLAVERDGTTQEYKATLGERKYKRTMAWAIQVPEQWQGGGESARPVKLYRTVLPPIVDLGFVVDRLSEQLARKLHSPQPGGLLVTSVRSESPAEKAGFQAGDVLFLINGRHVLTLSDVQESISMTQDRVIEIRFVRDGKIHQKKISLP